MYVLVLMILRRHFCAFLPNVQNWSSGGACFVRTGIRGHVVAARSVCLLTLSFTPQSSPGDPAPSELLRRLQDAATARARAAAAEAARRSAEDVDAVD